MSIENMEAKEACLLGHPCCRYSLSEVQSATHNFNEELIIGSGGFGMVYKGFFDDGDDITTAAIKLLNHNSNQGEHEFCTEIDMLSKFRHCNLVSLIGYCNDNGEMALVYEYMPRGSLYDHLHKMPTCLSWIQLLEVCIGAARGLDYLHTGTSTLHRIIHRDVKSSNILLDMNLQAKVSDFGLSKVGATNQASSYVFTNVKGSIGYLDPMYFSSGRLTRKSDVYSFGVVLFEVLCGRHAVDTSLSEEQHNLANWVKNSIKQGGLDNIIDPRIRGVILPDCLKNFVKIALNCLHEHSKSRPSMAKVVAELESALALQEGTETNLQHSDEKWITGAGREMDRTGESGFNGLPKDCIAEVLSLTTPRDACQVSLVAKLFNSAAESDSVWEKFLPYDYREVIATSINPSSVPHFSSTKQLYLHLSDYPLIIDGGYKSFSLEKRSGKKCYMLAARSLSIAWGDTPQYWTWTSIPDARFEEVAMLKLVWWLDIEGIISTNLLSPDTNYAAYLVYKCTANARGFEFTNYRHDSLPPKAFFGMAGDETSAQFAVLEPEVLRQRRLGQFRDDVIDPKERQDGWLEVELGEYYNNNSEKDVDLRMGLKEVNNNKIKGGLIVQGIEIRPKSFSSEKRNGKKWYYMLAARSLSIAWGDSPQYWTWTSLPDVRFEEVAVLKLVWWLDIRGIISTYHLSPDTNYAAYLVYKLPDCAHGFEFTNYRHGSLPPKAFFGMAGDEGNVRFAVLEPEALRQRSLGQVRDDVINPKERQDGWLEVELGEYYNNNSEEYVELKMGLKEVNSKIKGGLIVQGIEIRPKETQ